MTVSWSMLRVIGVFVGMALDEGKSEQDRSRSYFSTGRSCLAQSVMPLPVVLHGLDIPGPGDVL